MMQKIQAFNLPVGFKFLPSDQQLVEHYLFNKIHGNPVPFLDFVRTENLYGKKEPWEIWEEFGGLDLEEEEDIYFFTHLKKKSANGSRFGRKVGSGSWKGEDAAKEVVSQKSNKIIGSKKRFKFENAGSIHDGCWIMHELSLDVSLLPLSLRSSNWVICRIAKNGEPKETKVTSNKRKIDQDQPAGKRNTRITSKLEHQISGSDDHHHQVEAFAVVNQQESMSEQSPQNQLLEPSVEHHQSMQQQTPSTELAENPELPPTEEIPHDQLGQIPYDQLGQDHQNFGSQQLLLTIDDDTRDHIQWLLASCDEKLDFGLDTEECVVIMDLPSSFGKISSIEKGESDEQVRHNDQLHTVLGNHPHQYLQETQPQPMNEQTLYDQLGHIVENGQCMHPNPPIFEENQQQPTTEQSLQNPQNMQPTPSSYYLEENHQLPATGQANDDSADYCDALADFNSWFVNQLTSIDNDIYPLRDNPPNLEENQQQPTTVLSLQNPQDMQHTPSSYNLEQNHQPPAMGLANEDSAGYSVLADFDSFVCQSADQY